MRTTRRILVLALGACALTPAAAEAATRYAAPAGTGSCASASPCSMDTAVTGAAIGDEVIITPGAYTISSTLFGPVEHLDIHGQAGQPVPTITVSSTFGLQTAGHSRVADLNFTSSAASSGAPLAVNGNSLVERVTSRVLGTGSAVRLLNDGLVTLRDSTFLGGSGPAVLVNGAVAFGNPDALLDHVTAVSRTAGGVGLEVTGGAFRSARATVTRSVISGTTNDVTVTQGGAGARLVIGSSFVRTIANTGGLVTDLGDNSALDPLFVDAGGGDLHQAPGSPTIDAAGPDGASSLDVDRDPRTLGGAQDAGADEFRPLPVATTGAAAAVTTTAATVAATVGTLGLPGTWTIQYGPTTAYGRSTTARALAAGRGPVDVAAALEGLAADGDVHYRVVATTGGGTTNGADATLHTAAAPPVPAPGGGTVTAAALKITGVKVKGTTLSYTASAAAQLRIVVKRGTRTVKTITRNVANGKGTIKLGKLAKGRYTVSVTATSQPSKPVKVPFKRP
ncbi:MAG: hypothetical protein JWO02_2537 [Solirubrobacterales bacterium]|nr:hypothetical protein [Solirubrobacterales bacterium]